VVDKAFVKRVINWARASRPTERPRKSSTAVICDWIKMFGGAAKVDDAEAGATPEGHKSTPIDFRDARVFDEAYRSPEILDYQKKLIVLHYVYRLSPEKVEHRLRLPSRSFDRHRDLALRAFQIEVEKVEEMEEREET
jgi:hypothetical protein